MEWVAGVGLAVLGGQGELAIPPAPGTRFD